MIRAAFLKYSGQCRIGRMDGAFVTYHNTQEIFGFQYVKFLTSRLFFETGNRTTAADVRGRLTLSLSLSLSRARSFSIIRCL